MRSRQVVLMPRSLLGTLRQPHKDYLGSQTSPNCSWLWPPIVADGRRAAGS